jgi:hypothetical protein
MKLHPFPIWYAKLEKPENYQQYGALDITLTMGFRPPAGHHALDKPVPVILTPSYPHAGRLTVHFQCNRGEIAPGTTDGCRWYGGRICYAADELTADCPTLKWWRKNFTESHGYEARNLIEWLTAKATRVAFSPAMSEFVDAHNHEKAESYRLYYETGIPSRRDRGGCIINTHAPKTASDEEITAAVSKALRESPYCSDHEFAEWIQNGSQWECGFRHESKLHAPPDILDILGHPADEETRDAAHPAAA